VNLNATLLGQFLTFGIFVFVMVRFVWPPVIGALSERQQKIGDGLAAAEKSDREARAQAAEIVSQANKRGLSIVDEAKVQARVESDRIVAAAHAEIDQERNRLREALRGQVSAIAVAGAGRILEREIDAKTHAELLDKLAAEL